MARNPWSGPPAPAIATPMSALSTAIVAFSMSADAFAVAVGKGAVHKPRFSEAVRTGAIFGAVEATTPVIGWLLGLASIRYISAIDHWVAFAILVAVGGKMLWESLQEEPADAPAPRSPKFSVLLLTAVGTSIDAMAVGVTFALLDANIWIMAAAIGSATFLMATIGLMTGHYIGKRAGKWAEAFGGVALMAIGSKILLEHTQVF